MKKHAVMRKRKKSQRSGNARIKSSGLLKSVKRVKSVSRNKSSSMKRKPVPGRKKEKAILRIADKISKHIFKRPAKNPSGMDADNAKIAFVRKAKGARASKVRMPALNSELMLAKDLFDNPGKNSTRQALGDALVALGEMNKDLVVLTADLADSTRTSLFEKAYPDRFFNVGIAEQNMLGIAAGLSFSGKTPFATTFGIFATGRAWDQLRTSICYPRANVKVAATHCGITVGEDGATHQSLSDIALTRTIPNLVVLSPCDYNQAKKAVIAAAEMKGPVYIRLGRPNIPLITTSDTPFQVGKAQEMIFGKDVVIMATGELVYEALAASKILLGESIKAGVLNVHTIKPLDEDAIRRAAVDSKLVVTAEDHHVKGGLGSAVAEVLSSMQGNNRPHQLFIGVKDVFGKSGSSQELMKEFKLTSSDICEAVRKGMRMRAQR